MKSSEIKIGETYLFISTDNPVRKHLEGKKFTVYEIKRVWRRVKKKRANVKRFFNEFGEGARAEELEPVNENVVKFSEFPLTEGWEDPAFARVDPKEYEVNNDGNPF